jgi:hypothetical protein
MIDHVGFPITISRRPATRRDESNRSDGHTMFKPTGNIGDAAPLIQVEILEETPQRATCRLIRQKSRRSSQENLRSRRRKARREIHGPRCRRRCRIPANHRGLMSCRAARPTNCPCEVRQDRARLIQPTLIQPTLKSAICRPLSLTSIRAYQTCRRREYESSISNNRLNAQ